MSGDVLLYAKMSRTLFYLIKAPNGRGCN